MAHSVFGLTSAIINSDFLPQYTIGAASTPTTARVTEMINRRAARVSGLVDALGLDANTLDSTNEPTAFYFCQRLAGVGTAVDVFIAFTGRKPEDGPVKAWADEWKEGIRALSSTRSAHAVLSDALGTGSPLLARTHIQHGSETPSAGSDVDVDGPQFLRDMDL